MLRRATALIAALVCFASATPCLAADRIDGDAYTTGAALGATIGGVFCAIAAYDALDDPYKELGGALAFFGGGMAGALVGLGITGVLDLTIDGIGGALATEERSSALMPMPPTATFQLRW